MAVSKIICRRICSSGVYNQVASQRFAHHYGDYLKTSCGSKSLTKSSSQSSSKTLMLNLKRSLYYKPKALYSSGLHLNYLDRRTIQKECHLARLQFFGPLSVSEQIQQFHTSPQRNVPPILWILIKPVAKLGAIITGRQARKWWQTLPYEERQSVWMRIKQRWYLAVALAATLVGLAVVYYQAHIEETPLTGRKRFITVTHQQFNQICQEEAEEEVTKEKDRIFPATHAHSQRIQRIGDRLLQANYTLIHSLLGDIQWKCYVVDDTKTINAHVYPTGHIFVYSGLIELAENDDQLAIILAHEMSHALLSHGLDQVSYSQLIDVVIITAMGAIWFFMPTDGISLITQWFHHKFMHLTVHLPYSRQLEKEADKIGIQLAARACYDVREGSVFWARVGLNEDAQELKGEDKIDFPEWLSTHPSNEKRVRFFDHLVPQAEEVRVEAKCPMLSAKDPRDRVKELSAVIRDMQIARKAGQNLSLVPRVK